MLEKDEMYRLLKFKYGVKVPKVKKPASYMLQENKVEIKDLPLD